SILLTEGGCSSQPTPTETAFMWQHVPESFLQEFAEKKGLKCVRWTGSSGSGGLPCRKEYHLELDGGSPARDQALIAYQEHIREAITASGGSIQGQHEWGRQEERSLSSFGLDYVNGKVTGFFHVTSAVNDRGKADIFVIMYEHLR